MPHSGFGHSDCERIADGVLAQPVLALTSLAYVAAGVAVLRWALRGRGVLAAVAGGTLVAVGFGSIAYHGPQPEWAGLVHDWPIVAAAAVYTVGLVRGVRGKRRSAWFTAAGILALGVAAYVAGRSGSPLCRPDSLWQYHGAWHILSGTAGGVAAWAMMSARGPAQMTIAGD
ncbi:hypothetical protein A5765_22685 [Mycolicibacterium celeriflavum]|uniref:hypothetical protein n=1 Tax=Mycolicibacterium celeriflavum TaxID=1249101 RepID=UPI0007FDFFAC|nr:hypothetical protein [Mycolicibacterium celeriflavum]OBG20713.1 hypothetical protein A5765_22685 [Mycolicibacterium celeriflavum]